MTATKDLLSPPIIYSSFPGNTGKIKKDTGEEDH